MVAVVGLAKAPKPLRFCSCCECETDENCEAESGRVESGVKAVVGRRAPTDYRLEICAEVVRGVVL